MANYDVLTAKGNTFFQGHKLIGTQVSNGILRFSKSKSEFLAKVIHIFKKTYNGNNWTSGGSTIFTKLLKRWCPTHPMSQKKGTVQDDILTGD